MRRIAVYGLVCATALGGAFIGRGQAADLDTAFAPPPASGEADSALELGTGWYLRGDVGWEDTSREQLLGQMPSLTSSSDWTGGIGAGYRWNNWFRTDLTLNYDGYDPVSQTTGGVTCVNTLTTAVTNNAAQTPVGYFWTPSLGTCDGHNRGSILKTDVMVGGYVDIGTWYGMTPYVGAGVGFARIDTWNSTNYTNSADGTPYSANLTATGGAPLIWVDQAGNVLNPTVPSTGKPVAFAKQNWSVSTHNTKYNFAWSLAGGVAYAIDDHLSVDLGYRYVNLGTYKDAGGNNKTLDAQQVRVGFRYAID